MNTLKNAVLYIRVSTDEQAKYGYSIDMQQTQCFNFAMREGYNVIGTYIDDGYTARNPNRPQYKKLFEDIKSKKNGISYVIVWRCDRMVRNTNLYHSEIVPKFAKYGVGLLSATENNDMNNPYGRYMRNTQINNAELESELTSIRTKENLKEKARQGYFPGSIPPVGYVRGKVDGKKIIVVDKEKAPYVKEVFKLYTQGLYTYKEIAEIMAKKGFIHNHKPCSKKLVENILTVYDVFYIGKFTFKGEVYAGKHEPILTLEEYVDFKRVKDANYRPKKQRHNFIYKGLITCQKTGKTFCGELQKGSHKSGEYEYYRCHHACPYSENCKRIIKKSTIDESVNDMLSSMTITKKQFEEYKDDMRRLIAVNKKLNFERLGQIEKQINKLENRLGALYDDKLDELIAEDLYIRKRNLWQGQIDELMLELTGLRKNQGEIYNKVDGLLELCKDLAGAYSRQSDDKKRKLLKLLCSNLFYDGSNLDIIIKEPFTALVKFAIFKTGAGDGIRTHAYRNHNPRS